MQIFGKEVPSSADLWRLHNTIVQTTEIWKPDNFKESAMKCGLRRVALRKDYSSFSGDSNAVGQAPIVENFIEEIRLFIGKEPKDLSEDLYEKDRKKISNLASEYSKLFRENLGPPRIANANDIFEYNDHRIRVLATDCVWVVISKLSIIKQLPNDWWAADVRDI